MIDRHARPRLAGGVRLQADRVRGGYNLLAPEHVLRVNASSAAILTLCDGSRELGEIVELLAERYQTERSRIASDCLTLIEQLAARRVVET
jgi:pyrroloquinoline quinone biosynthesis protein D